MQPRLLILETSQRVGKVALASGETILAEGTLDEARRHARDLAPAIRALLQAQSWRARDLDAVIVSKGPGSYTGLRVGIMSAKTLAYATGCALIGIDTFDAIRRQASPTDLPIHAIDVIADAQQNKVYAQRFGTSPEPLVILPFETWLESALAIHAIATGPGLEAYADRLPAELAQLPREDWLPRPASLLHLGLERFRAGQRDDPYVLEPIYLRASSAEEKWNQVRAGN